MINYAVVVAVTVTGSGVTTAVTTAVLTVAVVVRELVTTTTDVVDTVTLDVAGTSTTQEQKADRSAG